VGPGFFSVPAGNSGCLTKGRRISGPFPVRSWRADPTYGRDAVNSVTDQQSTATSNRPILHPERRGPRQPGKVSSTHVTAAHMVGVNRPRCRFPVRLLQLRRLEVLALRRPCTHCTAATREIQSTRASKVRHSLALARGFFLPLVLFFFFSCPGPPHEGRTIGFPKVAGGVEQMDIGWEGW